MERVICDLASSYNGYTPVAAIPLLEADFAAVIDGLRTEVEDLKATINDLRDEMERD